MATQFPIKSASNQWEVFGWRQLEFDFDNPPISSVACRMSAITPADLVLDQIYALSSNVESSTSIDPDEYQKIIAEISNLCVEYFYGQDGG